MQLFTPHCLLLDQLEEFVMHLSSPFRLVVACLSSNLCRIYWYGTLHCFAELVKHHKQEQHNHRHNKVDCFIQPSPQFPIGCCISLSLGSISFVAPLGF